MSVQIMFQNDTMFEPAQLLRNWSEHRPSNQYELDSCITEDDAGSLLHGDELVCDFILVSQ
jgi:hypothetical protein